MMTIHTITTNMTTPTPTIMATATATVTRIITLTTTDIRIHTPMTITTTITIMRLNNAAFSAQFTSLLPARQIWKTYGTVHISS